MQRQIQQMENKMNENREQMENKMDENREQIKKIHKKMEQMEQMMLDKFMQTLDGMLPNSDNVSKVTHENKGSSHVEQPSSNKHLLGEFNSNSGVNYGWVPKCINFTKVELKKFDGTKVFT